MSIESIVRQTGLFDEFSCPTKRAVIRSSQHNITQAELLSAATLVGSLFQQSGSTNTSACNGYVINLCSDRYHFVVGFCAAIVNNFVSLLPSNRQYQTVAELVRSYPGALILVDDDRHDFEEFKCIKIPPLINIDIDTPQHCPMIDNDQLAAIVFTSGSTGKPTAIKKPWRTFVGTARLLKKRFLTAEQLPSASIIATVPPQHMYGMETTVMLALHGGVVVSAGQPFFAEDVREALSQSDEPRVLVTTPVHLSALIDASIKLPALSGIISATAPLTQELASSAEQSFSCTVNEIFGCSEAGSFATRNSVTEKQWTMLDDMLIDERSVLGDIEGEPRYFVSAEHLIADAELQDQISIINNKQFEFVGRASDMLNVAGKRASLSDLSIKLVTIDGVEDGVVFLPEKESTATQRPAALVVSSLSEREIITVLATMIDPVFIPRPLKKVAKIPRNELGKMPHKLLQQALEA